MSVSLGKTLFTALTCLWADKSPVLLHFVVSLLTPLHDLRIDIIWVVITTYRLIWLILVKLHLPLNVRILRIFHIASLLRHIVAIMGFINNLLPSIPRRCLNVAPLWHWLIMMFFDFFSHQLHKFVILTTHAGSSCQSYLRKRLLSIYISFKLVAIVIFLSVLRIVASTLLIAIRIARDSERAMSTSKNSLLLFFLHSWNDTVAMSIALLRR